MPRSDWAARVLLGSWGVSDKIRLWVRKAGRVPEVVGGRAVVSGTSKPDSPGHDEEPDSLADLPSRLQLAAAGGFFLTWATIAFVPRLWGFEFFYEHFYVVGLALGLAWWSVAEHFAPRLLGRHQAQPEVDKAPIDLARLRRRAHLAAWLYTLRRASAWLIVPLIAVIYLGGHQSSAEDQELIDTQPHLSATIVKSERSPLASRSEGPEVTVDVGGRAVVLGTSFPGEDDVAPGDRIDVVVDPADPERVIAANSHADWVYSWWGELLLMLGIGGLGGGFWWLWAMAVPHKAALSTARRARTVHRLQLLEVKASRLVLCDDTGVVWNWTGDDAWSGPARGIVAVIGPVHEGAWPLVASGRRPRWPHEPMHQVGSE